MDRNVEYGFFTGFGFSTQAAAVPGVTDTEVTVGMTTPLSGPAALWGTTALGAKAWADYINDQGGVHGRKIKVILKDDSITRPGPWPT